uniref:Uncharacterized protein n=1 Tax=Romanomermis culicivorax TaxID=13658 RepID=A0A915IH74_ROMCU
MAIKVCIMEIGQGLVHAKGAHMGSGELYIMGVTAHAYSFIDNNRLRAKLAINRDDSTSLNYRRPEHAMREKTRSRKERILLSFHCFVEMVDLLPQRLKKAGQ